MLCVLPAAHPGPDQMPLVRGKTHGATLLLCAQRLLCKFGRAEGPGGGRIPISSACGNRSSISNAFLTCMGIAGYAAR